MIRQYRPHRRISHPHMHQIAAHIGKRPTQNDIVDKGRVAFTGPARTVGLALLGFSSKLNIAPTTGAIAAKRLARWVA